MTQLFRQGQARAIDCKGLADYPKACHWEWMIMTIRARPAQESDLDRLAQFWYERAALTPPPPGLALSDDARAQWRSVAAGWLGDPATQVLVAVDEADQPAGFIAGRLVEGPVGYTPTRAGEVIAFALDGHSYHPGAGRALVEALRAWFDAQGIRRFGVAVPKGAAVEQAFWRSLHGETWNETWWWTW